MNKSDLVKLVQSAESYCAEKNIRFTEPRRYTLEIIGGAAKPMGAYDVLEALGKYIGNPKPPTAYRAIEFLSQHGFIHRIESLNAYVICNMDHKHSGSQFLICDACGKVVEAHICHIPTDLSKKAEKEGFRLSRWDAELHGTCSSCLPHDALSR